MSTDTPTVIRELRRQAAVEPAIAAVLYDVLTETSPVERLRRVARLLRALETERTTGSAPCGEESKHD